MVDNNSSIIFDINMAHFATSLVTIAITEFNLFSILSENPASVSEVSHKLGIQNRAAEAMLNACVALQLLEKNSEKYLPTSLARDFLVKEKPMYIGDIFELNRGDTYGKLRKSILSNKGQIYGEGEIWSKHQVDEKKVSFFTKAMHGLSILSGKAIAESFDFSHCHTVLDIGGGSGAIPIMIALRYKHIKAVIFDISPVCKIAGEYIKKYELQNRVMTKGGDMFQSPFPEGADAILLSNILHDWNDKKCDSLLKKSYKYLPKGGTIIINEALLNEDKSGPLFSSLMDLSMLLWTEGRQFTGGEISRMLENSGFTNVNIIPTTCYYNIVTGKKE